MHGYRLRTRYSTRGSFQTITELGTYIRCIELPQCTDIDSEQGTVQEEVFNQLQNSEYTLYAGFELAQW